MRKMSDKLMSFLKENIHKDDEEYLSKSGRQVYRSLKSAGERAIKGMDIDKCTYESTVDSLGETLKMIVEGRHSVSIGNQVARRFKEQGMLAEVVQTKRGAKVIIRRKSE